MIKSGWKILNIILIFINLQTFPSTASLTSKYPFPFRYLSFVSDSCHLPVLVRPLDFLAQPFDFFDCYSMLYYFFITVTRSMRHLLLAQAYQNLCNHILQSLLLFDLMFDCILLFGMKNCLIQEHRLLFSFMLYSALGVS